MSTDVAQGSTPLATYVAEEILVLMARRRINKAELSRRLGVDETWVGRRVNGRQDFTLDDLEKISKALGVEVTDLFPRGVTETFAPTTPVSPGPRRLVPRQRDDSVRPSGGRPPNRPSIAGRPDRHLRTAPTG